MAFLAVLASPTSPIPTDKDQDAKAIINPRGEHVVTTDGTTFTRRTNMPNPVDTTRAVRR